MTYPPDEDDDTFDDQKDILLPLSPSYPTYRAMLRHRPRLRFAGAYISTVNYTRPGMGASNNVTWTSPVLIVTYYRYLRFYPDGTLIALLTTAEPGDVVPWLHREYVYERGDKDSRVGIPGQSVMKDALKGRWRLSGDPFGLKARRSSIELAEEGEEDREAQEQQDQEDEAEGDVHIETEGVAPRYLFKMQLSLASAGRQGTRNNKLNWKGYWSYNRLTDDWAPFGLKNDRPFYWSRVKSYAAPVQLST